MEYVRRKPLRHAQSLPYPLTVTYLFYTAILLWHNGVLLHCVRQPTIGENAVWPIMGLAGVRNVAKVGSVLSVDVGSQGAIIPERRR